MTTGDRGFFKGEKYEKLHVNLSISGGTEHYEIAGEDRLAVLEAIDDFKRESQGRFPVANEPYDANAMWRTTMSRFAE